MVNFFSLNSQEAKSIFSKLAFVRQLYLGRFKLWDGWISTWMIEDKLSLKLSETQHRFVDLEISG